MKNVMSKGILTAVFVGIVTFAFSSTASAHVTVKPAEVVTAGFQTFTVSVPTEKNIPTVAVRVLIPEGISYVTPTQKSGWSIEVVKSDDVENAVVQSITWSGATIEPGLRDEFTFAAKVPNTEGELRWKAYQTYADGTAVAWDRETEGGHGEGAENAGPFSVTRVVTESSEKSLTAKAEQAAANAKNTATIALSIGAVGLVIGLVGIFLTTRKNE